MAVEGKVKEFKEFEELQEFKEKSNGRALDGAARRLLKKMARD